MKVQILEKLWNYKILKQVANRKLTLENERPQGFSSLSSKIQLVWKRSKQTFDIRVRAKASVEKGDIIQVVLNRNDVFLMASRFLYNLGDEEFLRKIKLVAELDPKTGFDAPEQSSKIGQSWEDRNESVQFDDGYPRHKTEINPADIFNEGSNSY